MASENLCIEDLLLNNFVKMVNFLPNICKLDKNSVCLDTR
jgi:hypothetical protein